MSRYLRIAREFTNSGGYDDLLNDGQWYHLSQWLKANHPHTDIERVIDGLDEIRAETDLPPMNRLSEEQCDLIAEVIDEINADINHQRDHALDSIDDAPYWLEENDYCTLDQGRQILKSWKAQR